MNNEEKLIKMLKYVSEHNDFYKNRIKEYGITNPLDITQWPILTRKELQENRYNMFSDGYKTKYFYQQLHRQTSSGFSGIPVNVYWDYRDLYSSNLSLWRKRYKNYHISPKDRCVMFNLYSFNSCSNNRDVLYSVSPNNLLQINISLIHYDKKYEKVIELIDKFQPDWLYIQPFVLNKLIDAYVSLSIIPPKSLRYIESFGEILLDDLKSKARSLFNIPIVNMYGSEEMNGIAYECSWGVMHILDDNVFVEIKHNGNSLIGKGESIISNLNNYAMPLIRYNQGDIIEIEKSSTCYCGEYSRSVKLIDGRKLESIIIAEDKELTAFMLMEVMAEVNNLYKDIITDYSFIFHRLTCRLECLVNIKNIRWLESVKTSVLRVFSSKIDSDNLIFDVNVAQKENILLRKQRIINFQND